jgi:hypothetical protein
MEDAADALDALAMSYRALAHGRINPHSNESRNIGVRARHLIRELVTEWL